MLEVSSLRDVVFANPYVDPDRPAILFGERRCTHAELRRRVAAVAAALRRDGVEPGDRVAVLLENVPAFLETYFAATAMGAIFVPLNWRLHPAEHANLLQDAEPKALIVGPGFDASLARIRAEVPSLRRIVGAGAATGDLPDFLSWSEPGGDLPAAPRLGPDASAAILYTSGTTSRPKGVVLTHGNYLADFRNVASVVGADRRGVNLQLSPLYHAACVHSLVHIAYGGATILDERFDAGAALRQIEKERVTYLFAVPTMLYQMMDRSDFDRSSLRTISFGAAGITRSRLDQAIAAFGPKLIHAYGLTETTSHSSILTAEDHAAAVGSIGRGVGKAVIQVVDEAGSACPPDVIGEIVVRGPHVMKGYWRQPEATRAAIVDGWLHTGDLGRSDACGFVYVVDRKKDMVISGGVNIYPREIEDVIAAHPAVSEVAVFGVPDIHWGEALVAAVVLRVGMAADVATILAFCRDRVGGYKVPKRIELVTSLPRNPSGKVLKTELRKSYAA